ncbi:DUF4038 domain-containing protein [Spirosoma sp. KCTC 42546]|nr:DUF4038 domain-containing protein [Spirosoma sp. KCTC 42546]
MRKIVHIVALLLEVLSVFAQSSFKNGPLKVSDNHRYLVHQDGAPFFYMGDTAWELFHRLNREEADRYLKRRAEQGFTVIQTVALAEFDGLNTPNALGDKPLLNNDPTTPNEAYFKHVDYIVDKAAENNLVIGFLPTWGDKLFKSSWGNGPEIFNPKNARTYGQWLGNRYKNRQNIIWILGGDRTPRDGSEDVATWRAMAEGIEAGVGGADKALMTFHPQPNSIQDGGSSKWFHQDSWLDFNMHQNGHCRDTPVYDKITVSYNRTPTKPTMDAEPIYEDHPVCFNVLVIGFLPTWGDKLFKSSWGNGPEIFNPKNARTYGQWLGNRYKNRQNIIWILGGDRTPRDGSEDVATWRAMAEGIEAGVGGADKALMTFHPQPNSIQDGGSSKWFHQDSWLDFNMHQNGHCRDTPVYDKITVSYNRTPTKPTMDAEPIYEDHPVCFNVKDLGTSNAYDVRLYAYLDLFAGAHGHTYGCHDIWQMYSANRPAVNGPHIYWQEALELPGANQMKIVRRLIESRPLLDRVPDQSLIIENNYAPAERIQATRGTDYAFVYSAAGKPFTVNLGKISGQSVKTHWLNPRTGEAKDSGTIPNKGQQKFTPPSSGYGQDWVLVLDDLAKNYPVP